LSADTTDDKQLLKQVFAGREGAFEELLARYRALVYSVFAAPGFRFPRDFLDDLFQSFVLALANRDYRKLRAYQGRNSASLATFLQVVATRFALDERRKWARHPRGRGQAGMDDDEFIWEFEDEEGPAPADSSLDQEELDTFHNLLFLLDWKRISAILWVFRDVQRERVAEVMATSRANIDALYKRGKDQMAKFYADDAYPKRPRRPDPEVLTGPVTTALTKLLPVPTRALYEALLQPGAKRAALLGLVVLDYPRFLCNRAELARLADTQDVEAACLAVLGELAERTGASNGR
jgi:DNA-directed RNA polymerase specialized sigma24 family protein